MCSSTEQVQDMTASLSFPPLMNRSVLGLNIVPTMRFIFLFFFQEICVFELPALFVLIRFKVCVTDKQQEVEIMSLSSERLFA